MPNVDIELTIAADSPALGWDGDTPELRKDIDVHIHTPGFASSSAAIYVKYRGAIKAYSETWAEGTGQIVTTMSFNTDALVACFTGRGVQAVVPLDWELYVDGTPRAYGRLPCKNNPPAGFDPPSVLSGHTPMYKEVYDDNLDDIIDPENLPSGQGGGIDNIYSDRWTLTPTQVAQKYVSLTQEPDGRMYVLQIEGGYTPVQAEDFVVDRELQRLSWDGLDLDGILATGDVMVLQYSYVTPEV